MFNSTLQQAVNDLAALILPLSEKDLERNWVWKDHDKEGIRFSIFVTIQELRHLAVELAALRTPPTSAHRILSQYHAQYMDLQAALLGLSDEDAEKAPAEGEWPVRRVYAHILGADIGFSATIRYALERHRAGTWTSERMSDEDEMRIVGMTEEEYNVMMEGPLEGMRTYHRDFHPKVLQDFSVITDAELDLPSTFWEETRFPIHHRLHRYEAHIIQHTVQIDKTLAAIGAAPGETKRLIRYLFSALAEVEGNFIGNDNGHEMCDALAGGLKSRMAEIQHTLS
jgi:hypothetical protein